MVVAADYFIVGVWIASTGPTAPEAAGYLAASLRLPLRRSILGPRLVHGHRLLTNSLLRCADQALCIGTCSDLGIWFSTFLVFARCVATACALNVPCRGLLARFDLGSIRTPGPAGIVVK